MSAQERATQGRLITSAIDNRERVRLAGNTHPWAKAEFDRGAAPTELPMDRMLLVLKRSPKQQRALDLYLNALHDKNSPDYHRWLTPEEFAERFGAAESDIAEVEGWLRSNGLLVRGTSRGRGVIEFSGTAAQVQRAFNTDIRRYEVREQLHYANATDPEIPAAMRSVVAGIATMHNFFSHGAAWVAASGNGSYSPGETRPAFTFTDSRHEISHALVPDDLQTIYNGGPLIRSKLAGGGQKIAIAARSNVDKYDFQAFRALFQPFVRQDALKVIVNGVDPGPTYDADMVEATADVEYAGAMAPDADVLLVVSASTNDSDGVALSALYAVENNLAPVLSVSYSACEQAMGSAYNEFFSSLWQQAAAQGITVIVSSGDSGSAGCDAAFRSDDPNVPVLASRGLGVNGLASTPFNIAVGGTQFAGSAAWSTQLNVAYGSAAGYVSEEAWNESCSPEDCGNARSNISAGGGGPSGCTALAPGLNGRISCSGRHQKPSWQVGKGVPIDGARDIPDISLASSARTGYVLCYLESCSVDSSTGEFGFYVVGGTSLAAPSFAGVMALVNQKAGSPQGQAAPFLYQIAGTQERTCDASAQDGYFQNCSIRDITRGNNDVPCAGGSEGCSETTPGLTGVLHGYSAGFGYDLATGLGSVNVTNLVNNWPRGVRAPSHTTLALGRQALRHGESIDVSVVVAAESGTGKPSGTISILTNVGSPSELSIATGSLTDGKFTASVGSLPGGGYAVWAVYSGDSEFAPSTSGEVPLSVSREPSRTEVHVFANAKDNPGVPVTTSVPYGSSVRLDVKVRAQSGLGSATGSVTVDETQGERLQRTVLPLNNNGAVESGLVATALGRYVTQARYSGDDSLESSSSRVASFDVVKATPMIVARATKANLSQNEIAQIKIRVETESLSQQPPTGVVTVYAGGARLQSAELVGAIDPKTGFAFASAEMNIAASKLTTGVNVLSATYDGDTVYGGASTPPLSITVASSSATAATSSVRLNVTSSSGNASSSVGDVVTMLAQVTCASGEPAAAGIVDYLDNTHLLATTQVVGKSPARGFVTGSGLFRSRLGPGPHLLTAVFHGQGAQCGRSTSAVVTFDVSGQTSTETVLTASESVANPATWDLAASVLAKTAVPAIGHVSFESSSGVTIGTTALTSSANSVALAEHQAFSTAAQPYSDGAEVAAADLNGDGIKDVVTANRQASSISVLLGRPEGGFEPPIEFRVDSAPRCIVLLDANVDGIPDIVTSAADNGVTVWLGNGDGTFKRGTSYVIGDSALGMASGDFNQDGIVDLAVYSGTSPYLYILLGMGDGTFQSARAYLSGEIVTGIVVSDVNQDGLPDLVASGTTGAYSLTGDGKGGFRLSEKRPYDATSEYFLSQMYSPVMGDFNGDGIADLAMIPGVLPFEGVVVLGNSDGSFQQPRTIAPSGFTYLNTTISQAELIAEDVNQDGIADLVQVLSGTSNGRSVNALYVYFGNGDGSFSAALSLSSPLWGANFLTAVALTDLNGDGVKDVLATTRGTAANALTSSLMASVSQVELRGVPAGASTETIHAHYEPSTGSLYRASISNEVAIGALAPTKVDIQYGYKNTQGSCYLSGATFPMHWNSVPCFYVHVTDNAAGVTAGTVTLEGTTPDGSKFEAGPYTIYSDGSGGGYIYVFYNYGLGDAGEYTFLASYSGDGKHQASVSEAAVVTIRALPTWTSLAGPERVLPGSSAVLTGKIGNTVFSNLFISGPVSLYDGESLIGKAYASSNSFQFIVPVRAPGKRTISARFDGLAGQYGLLNATESVSGPISIVAQSTTAVGGHLHLSVSPSSTTVGSPVRVTATITGATEPVNGTITFFDGVASFETYSVRRVDGGGAVSFLHNFSVGEHTIWARYQRLAMMNDSVAQSAATVESERSTVVVTGASQAEVSAQVAVNAANSRTYDLTGTAICHGAKSPVGILEFKDTTTGVSLGAATLDVQSARPAFGSKTRIDLSGQADEVVTGDFNQDGLPDLALRDAEARAIHVLTNSSAGVFDAQRDYPLSGVPVVLRTADVNADGFLDLIAASDDRRLRLLLGGAMGEFAMAGATAMPFVPQQLVSGDLNGDGHLDLVLVGQPGTGNLAVLIGRGDGTFAAPKEYGIPVVSAGYSVEIADMNGDGALDVLLVTNRHATYELLGVGDGTLQSAIYFGSVDGNIAVGDLNGDGALDLVFAPATDTVAVQLGRGDGTFLPVRYYSAQKTAEHGTPPSAPLSLTLVDVNADGVPDIVMPGMILLGTGDGTFRDRAVSLSNSYSVMGDINGDGTTDAIALADGAVEVRYGGIASDVTLRNVAIRGQGTHDITVAFVPSAECDCAAVTSAPVQVAALQGIATMIVLSKLLPEAGATYGDSVTFQVEVAPAIGEREPMGAATVSIDDAEQTAVPLISGSALVTLDGLRAGTHTVKSSYSGDSFFEPSEGSMTVDVDRALPKVQVTTANRQSGSGGEIIFEISVRGPGSLKPSGNVDVFDGETKLGTAGVNDGLATFSASFKTAGAHNIIASYSGDSEFGPVSSQPYVSTVQLPDFTVEATPSSLIIPAGQSSQSTISVTAIGGYAGVVSVACTSSAAAACSLSSSTLEVGDSPQSVSITVTAGQKSTARAIYQHLLWTAVFGLVFQGLITMGAARNQRCRRAWTGVFTGIVIFCLLGCGGGRIAEKETYSSSQPVIVPVTVSSGSLSHTLELVVRIE